MVDLQTTIMIVEGVVLLGLFRLKNAISRYERTKYCILNYVDNIL